MCINRRWNYANKLITHTYTCAQLAGTSATHCSPVVLPMNDGQSEDGWHQRASLHLCRSANPSLLSSITSLCLSPGSPPRPLPPPPPTHTLPRTLIPLCASVTYSFPSLFAYFPPQDLFLLSFPIGLLLPLFIVLVACFFTYCRLSVSYHVQWWRKNSNTKIFNYVKLEVWIGYSIKNILNVLKVNPWFGPLECALICCWIIIHNVLAREQHFDAGWGFPLTKTKKYTYLVKSIFSVSISKVKSK